MNYLKLDKVPLYNESWAPIVEGMRRGNFFGTTGEVLFHDWGVEGTGAKSVYTANIEYTFPLEFAELVWSDGTKVTKGHRSDRNHSFRHQEVQDSLRRDRQEVGPVRSMGFGRRRSMGSAG